jgi:hypothetical protein
VQSIDKATRPIQNTLVAQSTFTSVSLSLQRYYCRFSRVTSDSNSNSLHHIHKRSNCHFGNECRVDGVRSGITTGTVCPPRMIEAQPYAVHLRHILDSGVSSGEGPTDLSWERCTLKSMRVTIIFSSRLLEVIEVRYLRSKPARLIETLVW